MRCRDSARRPSAFRVAHLALLHLLRLLHMALFHLLSLLLVLLLHLLLPGRGEILLLCPLILLFLLLLKLQVFLILLLH